MLWIFFVKIGRESLSSPFRTLFSITENFGIRATKIKKGNKKFHCPYVKILKE